MVYVPRVGLEGTMLGGMPGVSELMYNATLMWSASHLSMI
jgi:hypothetical protein